MVDAMLPRKASKLQIMSDRTPNRSHPIRPLTSLQSAMFLINSRSHLFVATPFGSGREDLHLMRAHLLPKLRG